MTKEDFINFFEPFEIISNFMSYFAPIFFGSIGLIIIFYGILFEYKLRKRKFFTIEAKIIKSNLLMDTADGEGHAIYTPEINYSYNIDGTEYISSKVFYGLSGFGSNDEFFMQSIVKKYPDNKIVTAKINEKDHNDSYLEEAPNHRIIPYIIGVFFVIMSIIFFYILK